MSNSTGTNGSGLRRRSEPEDLDAGGRRAAGGPAEDWFSDEIDWFQETERAGSAGSSRVGLIPAADSRASTRPPVEAGHFSLIRRRRITALAVLGLVFALAIVVPLVAFDDGGGVVEPATPPTTSAPQATTTAPTTTTTAPTTTTSGATPLRIVLPDKGSLRGGDRGDAVETLQRALAALGFAVGEPDGVFGVVTEEAVVDFQRSNNLGPDGVVGADTARLLNTALARRGVTE